ncbi:hypothetical protein [Mucilaginibacter pedocola]|uniref:Uncharacterized protein n=1 Tax=Mucilaginibacter pedocola TaxID=1792845 RepID=A0A1S9PIJ3_9SPHI|nr:hypothetical protein [Mucilaginibacter pedocola]OOQ60790.1 hypothetical protein BC343_22705 [Mucilaginibacter pedocola]
MNTPLQTITDGLTYAGEVKHIIINYLALLITVAPITMLPAKALKIKQAAYLVLFIMAVFQVVLWFVVAATGISVTWCALSGAIVLIVARYREYRQPLLFVAIAATLIAIIYYALTLPIETTIAHAAAVVLGAGLFWVFAPKRRK